MKKLIVLLLLSVIVLSSCEKTEKFTALTGTYVLECKIEGLSYLLELDLKDDMSGELYFKDGAMSSWHYERTSDKKTKCFTSLGTELEVKHDIVETVFDFVTLSVDVLDAYHKTLDGKDVSVLKLADGVEIYTDSQSGEPLRYIKGNTVIDIISHPQR